MKLKTTSTQAGRRSKLETVLNNYITVTAYLSTLVSQGVVRYAY